ncbi:hypothetical protein [Paenibacillus marinisediminis]
MKMKGKAWLNMLLALMMISVLMLSACSKAETPKETAPAPTTETPKTEAKTDPPKAEPIELKWFVPGYNGVQLPSEDKDFVKKAIEEKFNVKITFENMQAGTDFQTKLNSYVASNDIPDLFYSDGVASNQYIKDGVAKELTGLVTPEKMPNFFKYWTNQDELDRYQVQSKFARAPVPIEKQIYRSYYVRKDWLDKLGLPMPETYDDMINVMKAFTFDDPDGNSKNDTYGFTTFGGGANMSLDFPQYVKNGLIGDFILEGDKFIDTRTDLRMEKVLNEVKEMLALKVVDPDWLLNKSGQHLEKAFQGKAGIIQDATKNIAFDNNPNGLQVQTKAVTGVQTVDWQPFNPFASTGTWIEKVPGNPFMISSKSSDEKVAKTIEIVDWLMGEEGFLLTEYGIEGKHYTRDGNKIMVNQDAYKADIIDQGNFVEIYSLFTPRAADVYGLEVVDPNETDRDRAIVEKVKSYKIVPGVGTSMTVKEGMDLGTLRKNMNQFQIKIIFDEKDASNWPKYRQELMTTYGGGAIFAHYAEQAGAAHGKTITFDQ